MLLRAAQSVLKNMYTKVYFASGAISIKNMYKKVYLLEVNFYVSIDSIFFLEICNEWIFLFKQTIENKNMYYLHTSQNLLWKKPANTNIPKNSKVVYHTLHPLKFLNFWEKINHFWEKWLKKSVLFEGNGCKNQSFLREMAEKISPFLGKWLK